MKKRIVIKTVLVCLGIFLILISASTYFITSRYELDTEKRIQVIIAAADIPVGSIITDEMVAYKTIKESGYNSHMMLDTGQAVGKKMLAPILKGDYIPAYDLLPSDKLCSDDDRTIILPMDVEGRLANLIRKGSLIDIKVQIKDVSTPPQTVLSRVFVEDILDENGLSLGDNIGSKKAYAKVVLDKKQRDRVYVASQFGSLLYELYCNNTQKPSAEDFVMPAEKKSNSSDESSQLSAAPEKTLNKEDKP